MPDRAFCEPTPARRWHNGAWLSVQDPVAREIRLAVDYAGEKRLLWSKPRDLKELALGNVLLEWESDARGPASFPAPEHIALEEERNENKDALVRVRFTGPREARAGRAEPGPARASALLEHMRAFLDAPGIWAGAGCSHRAALLRFDPDGAQARTALLVEDIGRHNCLDRLAGRAALAGLVPGDHALFTTARLTASLYAKAVRLGVAFIVGRSAVTRAALDAARKADITLVGFCRPAEKRLTVFSDPTGRVL